MFTWLSALNPFRKAVIRASQAMENVFAWPKHIRIRSVGVSEDECLRELEREGKLPRGDLSIDHKKGIKMASFPSGVRSIRYPILSKRGVELEQDATKVGYITGSLYKVAKELPVELLLKKGSHLYHADLHISSNCPGVYRDRVCTTCGDISP